MPEGHTIHRLARDLTRDFGGHTLSCSSPQGRFREADSISGHVFLGAHAIGKHLFLDIGDARVHIHLGLFGRFRRRRDAGDPRPSVRLRLDGNGRIWDLTGSTACELMDRAAFDRLRARLGADPLADGPRPSALWRRVHASKRPIGALLLDQSLFAGVGNVYRAELLFAVRLHPETRGCDVPKSTFERLWKIAKAFLRRGVSANRIITVPGSRGRSRDRLYVYKRAECLECGTSITRSTLAARTMYHCPSCQMATSSR